MPLPSDGGFDLARSADGVKGERAGFLEERQREKETVLLIVVGPCRFA